MKLDFHIPLTWPDKSYFKKIRPSPEIIAIKRIKMQEILDTWTTFADYVLYSVFDRPIHQSADSKKIVIDCDGVEGLMCFRDNEFPYDIEGRHSVLWYGTSQQPYSFEEINKDVQSEIERVVGNDQFDFAWYVNPKMTIPEFFHVQVFWTCW